MADNEIFATPKGRLINGAVFVRDVYKDEKGRAADPKYKVELAAHDDDFADLEMAVIDAAVDKWGPSAKQDYMDGEIRSPFLNGDKLAADKEAKGKKGDAYKGMTVIRADSKFNKHGEDAEGGIAVFKEDGVTEVEPFEKGVVYNGCYGVAAVVIHAYDGVGGGQRGVKFYLSAFQKVAEGDRLAGERSYSNVFKPVDGGASEGRRTRRRREG